MQACTCIADADFNAATSRDFSFLFVYVQIPMSAFQNYYEYFTPLAVY